jgi:hypothetical protein
MTRPALRSDPCPGPMPSKPLRALPYEQLFLSITRVAVHADIDADAVQRPEEVCGAKHGDYL